MSLAPSALRVAIAAAIDTELGGLGFRESRHVAEVFPLDPMERAHLTYAVAIPETTPDGNDRQTVQGGQRVTFATSLIAVKLASKLRQDGQVADYDAGLQQEMRVVAAVLLCDPSDGQWPELVRVSRGVVADGTLLVSTMVFRCLHLLPLAVTV